MDDKEFFNTLKAIFYQLFSRKLMFVVFTGDPNKEDQWLLTNVDIETMRVYDESPAYHFAVLNIKDKDFLHEFFKRFPVFKTISCIVRVVDFCASLAKADVLSDCTVDGNYDILTVTYPEKNKLCEELVEKQTKEIGYVIPDIEVEMYYNTWKSGLVTSEDPYSKVLDEEQIFQDDKTIMLVQNKKVGDEKSPIKYALVILQTGFLVPTLIPFCKAIKGQTKSITLQVGYDLNTVMLTTIYDTPLLKAVITQPSQRWFVKENC